MERGAGHTPPVAEGGPTRVHFCIVKYCILSQISKNNHTVTNDNINSKFHWPEISPTIATKSMMNTSLDFLLFAWLPPNNTALRSSTEVKENPEQGGGLVPNVSGTIQRAEGGRYTGE